MQIIIGVTGIIGSGKSTVAHLFAEKNGFIIDADLLAKKALEKDTSGYYSVLKYFGKRILDKNCSINRKELSKIVNQNIQDMHFLESIIHPYVIAETKKMIQSSKNPFIILDVPLLFESKMDQLCDYTIYVYCEEKIRIQRLIERGNVSLEQAEKFTKNLMDSQIKYEHSSFRVDNSKDLQLTKKQVYDLINSIESE